MNIVKGVADLLRKSTPSSPPAAAAGGGAGGGAAGGGGDGSTSSDKLAAAPSPRVRFSDSGEEGVLNTLWQKYENSIDKAEKKKSLQVFVLHFIQAFKDWEPHHIDQSVYRESASDDTVLGCSGGHPSEVILILVQEIAQLTSFVTEIGSSCPESSANLSEQATDLGLSAEVFIVLECFTIVTRSVHNCRVFSYYGGVQKVTALLKAAVVKLKTLTSLLATDEQLSNKTVENMKMMQKILVYIVTIISNFMDLEPAATRISQVVNTTDYAPSNKYLATVAPSTTRRSASDRNWQQKAIVSVMEAGGVNWLVELLRVIRRLNLKEQWTDLSLHFITLYALRSTISENTRAQNHFRSIGGLEVLLDGLGLPSSKFSVSKHSFVPSDERSDILQLQILSLEILREAVFGNVNNLQFLCENGRIHKFANSICWPAFMFQEYNQQKFLDPQVPNLKADRQSTGTSATLESYPSPVDILDTTEWNEYSVKLSMALCSFLLPPTEIRYCPGTTVVTKISLSISLGYWEQCVRWIIKILSTVFPCIKACASDTELPNHIMILANTLQNYMLCTFRKVLISAPVLLKSFREEGLWDLIFSEKFFYFGSSVECIHQIVGDTQNDHFIDATESTGYKSNLADVNILQSEAISFLEFAATLNENTNNLSECSALLNALEYCTNGPGLVGAILKSFHVILQLATEQTLASFKSLDVLTRVLKVACIQAQELRKLNPRDDLSGNRSQSENVQMASLDERIKNTHTCVELAFNLFKEYVTISDHGRILVLHNANCIGCLFDLFQEENLRKHVLEQVLALYRLPSSSAQDHAAKLQLCAKYLETFTRAKEKEKDFAELSIDLLVNIREIILIDRVYYQNLFRNGECFLHIVSLLNGTFDEAVGEQLVLNVLQTLTELLAENDESKAAFRMLVGVGYQTLQSLLLDFCKWLPSRKLLDALLGMLVDGTFEINEKTTIKNEDVIILFLNVLQKSSTSLRHYGLLVLQQLLKGSITNRNYCFKAGLLSFLLDWFSVEETEDTVVKIAELIQIIGGHSISGKDIRKMFALLRGEKISVKQKHSSLLLTSLSHMLKETGPEAFFEFSGHDSGIEIKSPVQWPYSKGLSFCCWLRVENFPDNGMMGLFSFFTENGKGCLAMLGKKTLVYESVSQKNQCVLLPLSLPTKQWKFLSVTHTIGRAFSGGSQLRCYVDGDLVSTEKCRYAKVNEVMTRCSLGTELMPIGEEPTSLGFEGTYAFTGQMGPVYAFSDALSSEQIRGIYNLGPSYMYSFLGDQNLLMNNDSLYKGILDARDGISSKMIFGLNAQASNNRTLFNVSSVLDSVDKSKLEATIMGGTKLCSRRLLQDIIYCVGGVSVFLPLLIHFDDAITHSGESATGDELAGQVIELVASVLDGNVANQQQMHLLSGFSILGFLLQSVSPKLLNFQTLSALKHLFNVLTNCGMSEVLLKDALSQIYLNPHIWAYSSYEVQRELYLFLIQYFETDGKLLPALCGLPKIIDIVRQFYSEKLDSRSSKPLLHLVTEQVIGERPHVEEIRKIRLLLLSLAEMSLKLKVSSHDIRALVSFFEKSQDVACIEDILYMIIRALSQNSLLSSFLEQVHAVGGCYIFVNLLKREFEPIRLLGLQFLGKLLVGVPYEKKGPKLFGLPLGRPRSISENLRKGITATPQLFFYSISERLFKFPLSDHLCATFFDVLLGGASPKQVLQKRSQSNELKDRSSTSVVSLAPFYVPQMLVCIFKYMQSCQDASARTKILSDLLDLLDSNPSNVEAIMEYGWSSWLETSVKLDVFRNYKPISKAKDTNLETNELILARNLYSLVLSYCLCYVKGGWHQLEDTTNFLLLKIEEGQLPNFCLLRDIFEDIIGSLLETSPDENIFISQPCRDNILYLLKLSDELLVDQIGIKLLFHSPDMHAQSSSDDSQNDDISSAVVEIINAETNGQPTSLPWSSNIFSDGDKLSDDWWSFYDKIWTLIWNLNGKGQNRLTPKGSNAAVPSIGQRARGLVESLNIPAAEMAAVVVTGGIGTTLSAKNNKLTDKAMMLRGERFPRIIFHLVIMYLCKAGLENASKCVQQFITMLPNLISEEDQCKSRLHFLIWSLLRVRSRYGELDDGARFHVMSHLILETVIYGKSMLASNMVGRDDSAEANSNKESGFILNLVQKDRVLVVAADEVKYMKDAKADRLRQLQELNSKHDERLIEDIEQLQSFEDDIQFAKTAAISADDSRKAVFKLAFDEDQQIVADKWIHIFRALSDERGPWSACPFPNKMATYWKHDKTEDKWRRRLKLKRNYKFDERLCQPLSTKSSSENAAPSVYPFVNAKIPEKMKRFLLKGVRGITGEISSESCEDNNDTSEPSQNNPTENQASSDAADSAGSSGYPTIVQNRKEPSSTGGDNDYAEVLSSVHCVLVTPKRKLAGKLTITRIAMHFSFEFLVEGTGGSSVFNRFQDKKESDSKNELGSVEKLKSNSDVGRGNKAESGDALMKSQSNKIKQHRRWKITRIKAVHWTRYLLQYTATEIFFDDANAPIFLNFSSQNDAKNVGSLLVSLRNDALFPKGSTKDKNSMISFVDRRVALEMAESVRESWRRREISNFEYLMILNTLSGRSYNDLTQYPIFPWILADYSSEKLDFNKSSTFRDLSKPVGALDEKRFKVFEDRYLSFCDPDIPSFYYGSHYSSMGIVLYYLLRLEPFTALHRNLQGGKFDHADRLFHSIESTYRNCLSNTSDVKELTPEFFYMPEFLENLNSYYFGVKQDGEPLGDVGLPPWAKGSPEEFIHINREALESEYVSSNLHHWIDLIFGYKQRGKPAVEAANIFYYLTYEGAVDLENMDDMLQKSAIEDQIANFGQTPIQIFRKKHPRRGPPIPIAHPLYFAPQSITVTSVVPSTINSSSSVLFIDLLDSNVVLMSEGLMLSVKLWLTTQLQSGGNFTFSGSMEPFFGIGSDVISPRKVATSLAENVEFGRQCLAAVQIHGDNYLILCGNWENSFQIISLTDGRIVQSIRQHKDVVSCVAVSSDGSVIATGSYDTTIMIWHAFRGRSNEKRSKNANNDPSTKDHVIIENPSHILCGHDDIITCLFVSTDLDIVISGSIDGTCIFHTLREGTYVRSIRHPSGAGLSKLVASQHGRLVFYSESDLSLHMYSINGKHIASSESNGRLNCMELSCCGEFMVCAGDHGQIILRSMHSLGVVWRYEGAGKTITSLSVTPEECFLAGTKDGSLIVFSIENPLLRKGGIQRNKLKSPGG